MKSNVIRHDSFYAGISQDDRLQQKGEYTYGRNINIRKGQYIELEKKPVSIYSVSETYAINCQVYNSNYFVGCDDGTIRISSTLASYSTAYTSAGGAAVLAMVASGTTLFWWTTAGDMYYRTNYTDGLAWVLSTNVFKVVVDSAGTPYVQAIHYSKNYIFFINNYQISYVDTTSPGTVVDYGSFTSGGGAFLSRSLLIGLTEHANSFWAYDVDGRMYVIDQSIQAVTSVKNFKEPIIGVYNNSDYDLVLTASGNVFKALYMNGGVGPNSHTLLRRYIYSQYVYNDLSGSQVSDGIRFNFIMKQSLDASFCENGTIVYFIASEGGNEVIYSYGNKNNSLPPSLSIVSSKRSDGTTWGDISAIFVRNSTLYVAGNSGVTRYVESIPIEDVSTGATYQSSGYIITRVDTMGIYEQPKQAGKLIIGADIPDGTSIKIYYSMDEGNFTLLGTEIGFDEIQGGTGTATLIQRTIPSQTFNELAIKVELLTTDETITPRLFSLQYSPVLSKINQ